MKDRNMTLAELPDQMEKLMRRRAGLGGTAPPEGAAAATMPRVADLINELVAARVNARVHAADVAELRGAWENEHAEELAALKLAKERLASADKALRLEALSLYDKHGVVYNAPGVGVKVRRVAKYDADDAIGWAIKQDLRQFLAVKAKLFSKHALAVADTAPLGFVTIERVPFATLAKNLEPWVSAKGAA